MYKDLGISKESYDQLLSRIDLESIYKFCQKYMPGHIGLYHYIDARGRFIPNKYKQDIIANAIFDSLTAKDKLNVLQYLEDLENNFAD